MARNFIEINVKAAAIAGAVIGLLGWVAAFSWLGMMGGGTYGMMGYTGGYQSSQPYAYAQLSVFSLAMMVVLFAALGVIVAYVYNWALRLK